MKIKVAIVEDDVQLAKNISFLLNGTPGFKCCHVFNSPEEAIKKIPAIDVHVVLMDINLGNAMTGIECVGILKPKCPKVQFVMWTTVDETENIFKALKNGASGYLNKTTPPLKIIEAISDVSKGGSPMSADIARKVVTSFHKAEENSDMRKLTDREKEILVLLSKGYRYKEIADQIFISTETVRTHIRNIYSKLQVNSRTDALNKIFSRT